MAWWRGSAIRKTVSISLLRRWFIATIWNSYSKSDTARRPRMITEAPTSAANLTSRLSKGVDLDGGMAGRQLFGLGLHHRHPLLQA